jgi:hypothetical protein
VIVDRHTPLDLFAILPELRLEMAPELARPDTLLEDDELFDPPVVRPGLAP